MKFTQLHERMVRDVFLNIELLLNDNVREVAEYDVQGLMFLFFRRALSNTDFTAEREKEGKVDCVIYEKGSPIAFYEIKTYFKSNEKLKKSDFDSDIQKLKKMVNNNSEAKAYFFVAGSKKHFKEIDPEIKKFVENHVNQNSRAWEEYEIDDKEKSRLRPSQKQKAGRSVVATWEIKIN